MLSILLNFVFVLNLEHRLLQTMSINRLIFVPLLYLRDLSWPHPMDTEISKSNHLNGWLRLEMDSVTYLRHNRIYCDTHKINKAQLHHSEIENIPGELAFVIKCIQICFGSTDLHIFLSKLKSWCFECAEAQELSFHHRWKNKIKYFRQIESNEINSLTSIKPAEYCAKSPDANSLCGQKVTEANAVETPLRMPECQLK